jgi:glycosyltransferase involved in cell wall biosynthesis
MIKVCHISTVHYAFDDRIFYKQCRSLAGNGYDVTLIVEHERDENVDGVHIVSLPFAKSRSHRFMLNSVRAFIKGMKSGAGLIHFHDPELILIGLLFRLFGRKVIYDVHELVYSQFEQKEWLNPVLRNTMRVTYRFFEMLAVHFFNRIILVVDDNSFRDYFTKNYPSHLAKFTYIRNFCMLSMIDEAKPARLITEKQVLIYAGGLSRIRGIREVIQAIDQMGNPPLFLIFGKWSDTDYQMQCMKEPGWRHVKEMGYKRLEEVYPYMKVADIGIALLYPVKNYLTSFPVKAFEYMACSLPILMSDFPFWKDTFTGGAWFTNAQNVESIRMTLEEVLSNKESMKLKGITGREMVESRFSWEAEEQRLLACYEEVLSTSARK